MKNKDILMAALVLSSGYCIAQSNLGARMTAMGQTSAAVADMWSVGGNPALITQGEKKILALNYIRYLETDISGQSVGLLFPMKRQAFGFYMHRYGVLSYHEIKASGMLARAFGNRFSLALRFNLHQLKIDNYGKGIGFSLDVGTSYQLTEQVMIGSYFNNLSSQAYDSRVSITTLPTVAHVGFCYLASDKITIASTISKEFGFAVDVGVGLEYHLHHDISLRAGITTKPFKHYSGLGIALSKLNIDIAVQSDPRLAYTPLIGIAYAF
jgi:hypothetical protein